MITQGSRWRGNPGLEDVIPLGLHRSYQRRAAAWKAGRRVLHPWKGTPVSRASVSVTRTLPKEHEFAILRAVQLDL